MALGMRDGTNFGRGEVLAPAVLAAYLVVASAIIALLALRRPGCPQPSGTRTASGT
jgi:hypothetical protein